MKHFMEGFLETAKSRLWIDLWLATIGVLLGMSLMRQDLAASLLWAGVLLLFIALSSLRERMWL